MTAYRIPLFDLDYGPDEEAAAIDVIRARWISMGERTAQLEREWTERLGVRHAIAVANGTAALHLAAACVLRPGDEVIVPSLTFVATVNAMRYVGARPVFADVESIEQPTISAASIASCITPHTRAIVPMHYAGFACDMDGIMQLAARHDLAVIEDAAHAPDARHRERPLGTIGDFGCFSFYSNKNIACAEGGMLVTPHDDHAQRVRLLRSHGMTSLSHDRARGHATAYDVVELGYNYRIDDIRAALLLAQLRRLYEDIAWRARLRARYEENLCGLNDIAVPFAERQERSSNYIFVVVLREGGSERRERVRHLLAAAGIQTSVHYPPVHRFEIYRDCRPESLSVTECFCDHAITLPLFRRMTFDQVDEVCEVLARALRT